MQGFHPNRRQQSPGLTVAVVLCLILLALISVVQVTHLHQTATEADHCALCLVMHSVVPVTVTAVVVLLVQFRETAPVLVVQAPIRRWPSQLFTRPPPQS